MKLELTTVEHLFALRVAEFRLRPAEAFVEGLLWLGSPPPLLRLVPLLTSSRKDRGRRAIVLPFKAATESTQLLPLLAESRGSGPLGSLQMSRPPILRRAAAVTVVTISITLEVNFQRIPVLLLPIN